MNNQDKKYLVKMLSIGWDFSIDTIYLIIFNVIMIRLKIGRASCRERV